MRKLSRIQKSLVAGAAVAGLAGSGVAFAYWTTSGSGSGTGSTTVGTVDKLTFTQNPAGAADTSVDLAPMYPGDSPQSLTVRVRNTSGESAYVAHVKAYITTDKGGCTAADFKLGGVPSTAVDASTAEALSWTAADLAAGAAANATSTVQFNNTGANQDACKGATVTLNYLAS
ncbi:MAG: hypothetical protein WCD35_10095 [Mycobacteriales bacterium]